MSVAPRLDRRAAGGGALGNHTMGSAARVWERERCVMPAIVKPLAAPT
jgi:hypothetical protein